MTLNNEVALVTGATRGIGRSIASELARLGACVAGTATSASGADTISAYLSEITSRSAGLVLDVTETESIASILAEVERQFGPPSILVNNAGITRDNLLMRMKDEDWDAVIDTNLSAMYRMCRAGIRGMMKARRGRIINIASVVGAAGNAGQSNYAAAKAGIMGFTKSLARELATRGITVNAVAPGFIDTDMTKVLSESQRTALLDQIPLGRLGRPDEIAATVAFLASPGAAYITGETLHVNGGMYMV